eukprot:PhM_4_TR11611/c0_g1_i1/m.9902
MRRLSILNKTHKTLSIFNNNIIIFNNHNNKTKMMLTTISRSYCEKPTTTTTTPQQQEPIVVPDGFEKPLWPQCDTPEEILEAEKYGEDDDEEGGNAVGGKGAGEVDIPPEVFAYAWKALMYGTLLAITGFAVLVKGSMVYFSFESMSDVLQHIRDQPKREAEKLRAAGTDVIEKSIDLTSPESIGDDFMDIIETIQRLADEAKEEEEREAEEKKETNKVNTMRNNFRVIH